MHETLSELSDALEDLDLRTIEKSINDANAFYNTALTAIEQDESTDLNWVTLLLKALVE
ncbi:hypothetical protein [Vibrio phage CAU_VPP01]|nr:hypothetical protein [Vibrio phage CAU_VPP01]